jgi:hypothetical protein
MRIACPSATPIKVCVPFVQQLLETSARRLRNRRLLIACAGSFSNSPNRDGGGLPRSSVLGGSQEFPLLCGRGEGAKKLSSVPGGHILGGMGEPAQLFRPLSNIPPQTSSYADIIISKTSSKDSVASSAAALSRPFGLAHEPRDPGLRCLIAGRSLTSAGSAQPARPSIR